MTRRTITALALSSAATALFSGCLASSSPLTGETKYLEPFGPSTPMSHGSPYSGPVDNVSYWDGDSVSGAPSIRISLRDQKAYFYKSGELVGVAMISTGTEGRETPTGSFKILQKNANHRSNLYGTFNDANGNVVDDDANYGKEPTPPGCHFVGAPMPFFMRVTNGGVGMHGGYLPGYPASHGCIRMPEWMAKNFFGHVSLNTPVTISY